MDNHIHIGKLDEMLAPAVGQMGGRSQILAQLRLGLIKAICTRFVRIIPPNLLFPQGTRAALPPSAENYPIPADFWKSDHWVKDGESVIELQDNDRDIMRQGRVVRTFRGSGRVIERFTVFTDWKTGNFTETRAMRNGAVVFSQRAMGVHVDRAGADTLLQSLGMTGVRPSHDELVRWMSDQLTENPQLSQNKAYEKGRAAFSGEKRASFLLAYQEAKAAEK